MKIRSLLEQLASEAAFAEADLRLAPEIGPDQSKRQCLVACDAMEMSRRLTAFAFSLAERMWCDLLMVCVRQCEMPAPGFVYPADVAAYRPDAPVRNFSETRVSYLRLHGDFFSEVQRLCSSNRHLDMAVLHCAAGPPASFRLDVPYFLFT